METSSTSQLNRILSGGDMGTIDRLQERFTADDRAFTAYMDTLIAEKGLKRQDIFQKADIPQKYGYKLLSGESHTTDRDKLLRLFIAMGLNLRQTTKALSLYGLPGLYPKRRRDAIIIIALNTGIDSVDTVNDYLREYNEPPLTRSGE